MLANEFHCLVGGHPVEHSNTRQRSARAPMTAIAGDLDSLFLRTKPGFTQRVPCVVAISWQSKVEPWHPSRFPLDRRRSLSQKVDREVGGSPTWDRLMKATTAQ